MRPADLDDNDDMVLSDVFFVVVLVVRTVVLTGNVPFTSSPASQHKTRKLNCHVDLQNLLTDAGSSFRDRVTLIFDLFTSGSKRTERLPRIVCLLNLVLIAPVVFLLERGHTQTQTHSHRRH